tara:strand:- start:190 stop:534 length:345 start_codon:yes stop_codon:yes gene_type:complete
MLYLIIFGVAFLGLYCYRVFKIDQGKTRSISFVAMLYLIGASSCAIGAIHLDFARAYCAEYAKIDRILSVSNEITFVDASGETRTAWFNSRGTHEYSVSSHICVAAGQNEIWWY